MVLRESHGADSLLGQAPANSVCEYVPEIYFWAAWRAPESQTAPASRTRLALFQVLPRSDVFLISQTEIFVTSQCFLTPALASTLVSAQAKLQGGPRSFPVVSSSKICFEGTFERGTLKLVL